MNFSLNARGKVETEINPAFFPVDSYCDLHEII